MREFKLDVGLSDHTVDTAAVIAVSLGARVIEKHFKLDQKDCDQTKSSLPDQLQKLVSDCKSTHLAINDDKFSRAEAELPNIKFRRSLYFSDDIKVGEIITKEKIRRVRPGYGLDPSKYNTVLGTVCIKNARKGDRVTVDHFAEKKRIANLLINNHQTFSFMVISAGKRNRTIDLRYECGALPTELFRQEYYL